MVDGVKGIKFRVKGEGEGEQSLGQVAWLGEEATEHPGKRH